MNNDRPKHLKRASFRVWPDLAMLVAAIVVLFVLLMLSQQRGCPGYGDCVPEDAITILLKVIRRFNPFGSGVSLLSALICAVIGIRTGRRAWKEAAVLFMIVAALAFGAGSIAATLLDANTGFEE